MTKADASSELKQLILVKETDCKAEGKLLKADFNRALESMKPVNLLRNTIKSIVSVPDLRSNLINTVLGMATGLAAKKAFVGKTHNPLTQILGVIAERVITNKVADNADGIKSILNILMKKITHWQKQPGT